MAVRTQPLRDASPGSESSPFRMVGTWVAALQHSNGGVVDAVVPCGSDATLSQRGWTTTRPNHLVAVLTDFKRSVEHTTSLPRDSVRRDAYGPARPSHSGTPTPWASPQAHAVRVYVYGCVVDGIQLRIPQCEDDNLGGARRNQRNCGRWASS